MIERKVEVQGKVWRIITVYSKEMKETKKTIEEVVEGGSAERLIIGGDFNAKIGEEGMLCCEDERREEPRRSKDKVKNAEGSKLLEMIEENGWEILNGNTEGDEEGELTFIGGKGNSVIDYVIIDPLVKEEIKCFKVETRTGSSTTNGRNIRGKIGGGFTQEGKRENEEHMDRRGRKSVQGKN